MRHRGAGQRWDLTNDAVLQQHTLVPSRTENAPLVQTFAPPGGRPFSVKLTFLASRPKLATVLATTFWLTYQPGPRRKTVLAVAWVLKLFCLFLTDRAQRLPAVVQASDLQADLLREFAVWLVARRRLRRKTAATVYGTCACFLRRARRAFPAEFDPHFRTPRHLFDGADGERAEPKALSRAAFQQILAAAQAEVRCIRQSYAPGDVPTSPQSLIAFMVLLAARTGINAYSLYDLERECLTPHELDEHLFYCVWDKPRARKAQRQLHRIDRRNEMGVVELIQFLQQYTEPLVARADPTERSKLFLFLDPSQGPAHPVLSPSAEGDRFVLHVAQFAARHTLPHFSLVHLRATAATQLYLETGGNLRKVQQFLQHVRLSTTVKYLLNSLTEPFHARVIQTAQAKMLERITVIPAPRAAGVGRLHLPPAQARKILAGRFDTGCGACRDPYDSPQPGEEKGRLCTAFHACFTCPNGLWFLEDLPHVIATRDRLVAFRAAMKPEDWEAVYGDSVRIINEQILAAFRPEQLAAATQAAARLGQSPLLVAKGVLA